MSDQKADILAQHPPRAAWPRQLALALLLLLVPTLSIVTAFGIAPGTTLTDGQPRLVREAVELPEPAPSPMSEARSFVAQERVLRGDTVAALLERLGVHDAKAMDFLRADATGRAIFRQLVPGRMLQAETGEQGELLALRYFLSASALLEVTRENDRFTSRQRAVTEAPRLFYRSATIRSSLFAASDAAGIPDAIAMQIARVFATDIDFHTDLRKGDRFSVVYDMVYEGGELIAPGKILAAEFVNDGRAYHAVLFRDEEGVEGYYSLDGSNRAKAFLRSPVEFSRVSSGFGGRFHPIFRNWRAHTGVDFAAPRGTRVIASADGLVVAAGGRGGYGNAVEIRHGGGITTLYAHLSGFAKGIRAGARVRQGEPIGYVGSTGFATGPHLHYEFKISGIHQDPMKVALPKAEPIPPRLRGQFMEVASRARSTIEQVGSSDAARFE
ncbi:MAG TPA: M23 family metallopeptidase [Usitatibacter sp.]|nr:M23 family metallopeptidase [Usitatibacter sp.]